MQDPIANIIRAKMAGGMAQEVEYLPSKCEALSSNTTIWKKKKQTTLQGKDGIKEQYH
jgi:hypothetical protein